MRGIILVLMACLMVLTGALAMPDAQAAPRIGTKKPKSSRPDADRAYDLNDIMKAPKEYKEREVFFYCRFAMTANLFKNINTRFNQNEHANFAVWADKTILWDTKGRKNVLPTLYVHKNNKDVLEVMRSLKKYELVAITGFVMDTYAGYPWILVTAIEQVQLPGDRLSDTVVEHMQNGHDALTAESGGVAARHFEQALQYGLPPEYRAKAYEQLAQGYLLDNQLDKALTFLRLAVETNREDPILNLALADVALRMNDPAEALAHCQFALERSGKHPQVYGIMGEARSLMEDYVKAYGDLNAAAGTPGISSREKAMVNVRRARIYTRAGRHPDAARVYAAASEPGEALAGEAWLHNEIGLFYEMLYLDTGDARYLDSAYSAYEEGSRLNRLDAGILNNMTETEFRRQRLEEEPDFALVRELIERIDSVEPEYTPSRILEGRVLWAEGKANEAEYRYQSVSSQIGNDATALMALAEAYMDLARYVDAASAVRRARKLQPWNLRVQALGDHLEKMAEAVEQARAEAYRLAWPDDRSTYNEPWQREEQCREPESRDYRGYQPMAGRFTPRQPAPRPRDPMESFDGRYGWAARRDSRAQEENAGYARTAAPAPAKRPVDNRMIAGADDQQHQRPEAPGRRYPQEIQASASPAPVPGKPLRPYPVTEVKLPETVAPEKRIAPEAGFEPVAKPAPLNLGYTPGFAAESPVPERAEFRSDDGEGFLPREMEAPAARIAPPAEAEVPESLWRDERDNGAGYARREVRDEREYEQRPAPRRERMEEPGYESRRGREFESERYDRRQESRYDDREQYRRNDRQDVERRPVREDDRSYERGQERYQQSRRDERYDERYDRREAPRYEERDIRRHDSRYEEPRRSDRYDERYDRRAPSRYDEYDAGNEGDRYDYGMLPGTDNAYASLPAQDYDVEDGLRDFSFEPDASPVIIAGMRSPSRSERDMPVRNTNLYRRSSGSRQPAEIIERDPVQPRQGDDASAMTPPEDGMLHRAEVRLPSSSRGVGMSSDYDWEN